MILEKCRKLMIFKDRFQNLPKIYSNSQLHSRLIKKYCPVQDEGMILLKMLWRNCLFQPELTIEYLN